MQHTGLNKLYPFRKIFQTIPLFNIPLTNIYKTPHNLQTFGCYLIQGPETPSGCNWMPWATRQTGERRREPEARLQVGEDKWEDWKKKF